jgi:hypothetical protein
MIPLDLVFHSHQQVWTRACVPPVTTAPAIVRENIASLWWWHFQHSSAEGTTSLRELMLS